MNTKLKAAALSFGAVCIAILATTLYFGIRAHGSPEQQEERFKTRSVRTWENNFVHVYDSRTGREYLFMNGSGAVELKAKQNEN